jgi:predicted naringenin-chalcone synthase
MDSFFISGVGTAVPEQRYTQAECWHALDRARVKLQLTAASQAFMRRVLLNDNGIRTRAFALASLDEVFDADPDTLHRRFALHAPALAAQAAANALRQTGLEPSDIDALIISTCTGYLCPGLTSYVAGNLGVRPDAMLLDLVGQGCGAALPNLATAGALLAARRAQAVLSICVEVCSAAFYLDDDPGVLISACLFGDGAGAAVLTREPRRGTRRVEWKAARSRLEPERREALRFEQSAGRLRNKLTPQVPELAAETAAAVMDELLQRERLSRGDMAGWILHAGGRNVLAALKTRLELDEADLRWSRQILTDYGNMSSAFVYFVLEAALRGQAAPGWWWLSAFGAGFSCHAALLKVA